MPSYGFGAAANNDTAIHIDMDVNTFGNRDVIHINIHIMCTSQQDIPKNSERIGTLTIPTGQQIGVFGGESMQSMNKGAAHFNDTGLNFGNTALIGHNRGRSNGFFVFVKDLEIGQSLTLEANGMTKTYIVAETHKIHATETELLMHFGDSRLTLLTCWENEKDYRRVVVAYEE
jgi:LPXTG-site transpeptidase (sortase) family protein